MGNVTISDIARESQVSKATVSRVLNNPSIVDISTRMRVQGIIDKYQYKPSALARNMSAQRTTAIGVLIPEVDNPFFSNVLRGALDVASEHDYTIVCFSSDEIIKRDRKAIQEMISYKYSGLLYTPVQEFDRLPEREEIRNLLETFNAPVVLMDRDFPFLAEKYDSVCFDDCRGICESVERLAAAGHKRIALINASEDISYLARIRNKGYRLGLENCGIPYDAAYHYILPEYSQEASYKKTCELLERGNYPTAFITCNNNLTLGFIKAISEYGLEISRDLDCIGLDRIEPLDIIGTRLNYIKRNGRLMGQKSAELVFQKLAEPKRERQNVILDHELVIRKL